MTGLRDLMIEVAEDARDYDVTDRAVRVVRRRRMAVRLVPVAAALLVAAGLVSVGVPFGGRGDPGPEPVAAAGLPARLVPQKSPPMLPGDRGVGPATLAYNADGTWFVVTADGGQYKVDGLLVDGMSPDGRWLLVLRSDGSRVLRDLTGTARQDFPGGDTRSGAVWSPDSHRLVVQISGGPAQSDAVATTMVDLTTGARAAVPLDPARPDTVCSVRNSGVLVLCPREQPDLTGLRLADGTTGRIIRDIPVADLGLRPGETQPSALGRPRLGPDDRTLYLSTRTRADGDFLVGYDLDTGRSTERYSLPATIPGAERTAPAGGVEYGQPDAHFLLGLHAEGPLLLHMTPGRSDPFTVGTVSIELIARDTGTLRVVTLVSRPIGLLRYPG